MASRRKHPPPAEAPDGRRRWLWRGDGRSPERQAHPAGSEMATAAAEQERLILEAVADLRELEVREVMTPRLDVVALHIPVHLADVASAIRESGHSAFPVVHGDLDDLVGVLYVNDLFRARRPAPDEPLPDLDPLEISRRVRQAHLVPESRRVLDTLAEMRRLRRAFAVVVDEHGGVAGVLTMKNLLEPLVGQLHDEFDPEDDPEVVQVDGSRWLVDGRASVDSVRDRLDMDIPEGEYVTIGGFLFDGFGHIPKEGEELDADGWRLRVVEMDKRRVAKVVATRLAPVRPQHQGARPAELGPGGQASGVA